MAAATRKVTASPSSDDNQERKKETCHSQRVNTESGEGRPFVEREVDSRFRERGMLTDCREFRKILLHFCNCSIISHGLGLCCHLEAKILQTGDRGSASLSSPPGHSLSRLYWTLHWLSDQVLPVQPRAQQSAGCEEDCELHGHLSPLPFGFPRATITSDLLSFTNARPADNCFFVFEK